MAYVAAYAACALVMGGGWITYGSPIPQARFTIAPWAR
jgi:hypothetical protein